jgi:hypothetical protein
VWYDALVLTNQHKHMKDILIPSNNVIKTPLVDFKTTGQLRIEGSSFSENPLEFYEPLVQWINDLKKDPPKTITMTVKLEYFNTSSSKLILYMFKSLESMQVGKLSEVTIVWKYNKIDQDMLESGKDYQSIINIPFVMEEYS